MADIGAGIHEPFDLIRFSLSEPVLVKLRGDREMRGILHAYDGHMNLMLGDVEETIYEVHVEEDIGAETVKVGTPFCYVAYMTGHQAQLGHDVCAW